MEATPAERQVYRGLVKDAQPKSLGLDQLLWELLQICALPNLTPSERDIGQMGNEEI